MDQGPVTPEAIVTLAYALAALCALAGATAWLKLVNRRRAQSSAGETPDLRGLSNAATATALAMTFSAVGYLYSLLF